ncbi:hypothetical protein [Marinomonas transparens]|uniref:Uncharacterized protein n=1 Tax=Marinomonas transparens TaxID=2795388 RepID=A0A934JIK8_9GAMM|nr:hypothetical protein [Marinomonas transparens]MBJ7536461.1 hypothetical protein [Marinomonas transparens]
MSKITVSFYDAHRPILEEGTYTAEFSQQVSIGKEEDVTTGTVGHKVTTLESENFVQEASLTQSLEFHVAGPRFNLSSSLVHSVFPPKGGKGDYRADLPKLVLSRSTLPWERSPSLTGTSTSSAWLFLLLIDESEMASIQEQNNVTLGGESTAAEIQQAGTSLGTVNVGGDLTFHPHKFNALAVDKALATSLLPASLDELKYLSYARIKEGEEEQGVLICNRLPKAGSNSTAYLISVENNYDSSGAFVGVSITPPKGNSTDMFFPYYDKWSFHSVSEQLYAITADLVSKITKANPSIVLPDLSGVYGQLFTTTGDFLANTIIATISTKKPPSGGQSPLAIVQQAAMLPGSTFHGLMSNLIGGFQALTLAPTATDITSVGSVKLPFQQLTKNSEGDYSPNLTNAYYRSPLVASTIDMGSNIKFPSKVANVTAATAFTWTIPTQGTDLMFKGAGGTDTSYAAAFELGRLMAINNTVFAKDFVNWKVQTAAALRTQKIGVGKSTNHIVQNTQPQPQAMPESVKDQFVAWSKLSDIPYQYFVPDSHLLPTESLRYFYIDINWVNAFLCGAFSIGYTVKADLTVYLNEVLLANSTHYQGFLLNSFAVSGWPNYDVDAYLIGEITQMKDKKKTTTKEELKLPETALLYRKNLSIDITMAVYDQKFDELKFHLHHSKVHSGFLYENGKYEKILNSGKANQSIITAEITSNRTINNLNTLAGKINATSVSKFAAGMLEGTPVVRFGIGT